MSFFLRLSLVTRHVVLLHLFFWKVELIQLIVDNLSVLQLDMIAAGQCLSFSVCLFALNLFLICFLKTANVFPLSSQLTMKINDLYIVFTSIFQSFSFFQYREADCL